MKYNLKEMLRDADLRGYAVPAFNFSDCWELKAILEAAAELRSPVICASNMQTVNTHTPQLLGVIAQHYIEKAETPVVFHLDHANDPAVCCELIRCGYPSVMYDGSSIAFEENIKNTRLVTDFAAQYGVCVEAEIGRIKGQNEESSYDGGSYLGSVEDAARLVEEGRCDSLAVGIGNAHGFYCEKPQLHFDRLAQINDTIDTPLVLHGGTGIPSEDIQQGIRSGINKVNVGTQLHFNYMDALRRLLAVEPMKPNVFAHMDPAVEEIKKPVREWIKVCMADGKA